MKSRRLYSFFLALILMSTRVGFALNVHYCGAEIAAISLAHDPTNCGMEAESIQKNSDHKQYSKSNCCQDNILLFQNHEPQNTKGESTPILFSATNSVIQVKVLNNQTYNKEKVPTYKWSLPPTKKAKIYLLNQSLVVYG